MTKVKRGLRMECYELLRKGDISLVFLPDNEVTPYAVVRGLDYAQGRWHSGHYLFDIMDAVKEYRRQI